MKKITPIHAGEILLEEFMQPLGLSQNALAKALHITPRRINEIVNGKRSITADTALRLARFFGNSAEFWMNLQNKYDLEIARDILSEKIDEEVEFYQAS
ncbi:HigA family addiction module antitoxin [Sulfurovum sp. NBC37-1]|uniref:HigA family addiction module antitoxin n=1 Tax=Sulfurovum sp. (strain NBC37-1) TaxID=387093 RepID=UPI0001587A8C|nr:HigA family addiction module antitoxin [Sulfurovum sp. NBC37-1]BAF72739.1 plasmid maintenance system antidote protein [Sulfurovum sp. NBC37-1]